jgi:copper homeostasis protein
MPLLEIACFSAESALIADASGADRIEICKDQHLGGTTPLLSVFQEVKTTVRIPVNVMIRPRGGNFTYDAGEIHMMEAQLEEFREAGASGFVFGILDGKSVDVAKCRRLVEQAKNPCTFHRAFDEILEEDMLKELEVLIDCGFKSVLTSGGKENAVKGSTMLRQLVEAANGRIDVIVGGGVRSNNLQALKINTGGRTFHSSAIVAGSESVSKEEVEKLKSITH